MPRPDLHPDLLDQVVRQPVARAVRGEPRVQQLGEREAAGHGLRARQRGQREHPRLLRAQDGRGARLGRGREGGSHTAHRVDTMMKLFH